MSQAGSNLGSRSVAAVFWGAGGTVLRMVLQIGAQITLARLLGPEQYGVFAIGATVIGFSGFFSDVGLAYGLIQKTDVTPRDVRFVFTWQIILGSAVTALVWAGAAPIAQFFGEPRAAGVVRVLSVLCLLNALAAPSLNLLKRQLDFKQIHVAQLASYVAGYLLVGIPMAVAGSQVWALVAAWIVQSVLNLLLLYRATRHAVKPLFWYEHGRSQSRYGGAVLGTNLVNWIVNNIDRIVIARVFGSREIGLYTTSYNLFYNPTAAVLGVVQPVFFSASSRMADDADRILRGYRTLLGVVSLLALPAFVLLAVASEPVIALLYGPQWQAAAALCRPIALAMPLFLVWGFTTPLLWTAGHGRREVQLQLPLALRWGGACVLAASRSVETVAWCVLLLAGLRCGLAVATAVRLLKIPLGDLWRVVRGGLLLAAAVAATVALLQWQLANLGPGWRVLCFALGASLAWLAVVRMAPAVMPLEFAQLLRQLLGRLPTRWCSVLGVMVFGRSRW